MRILIIFAMIGSLSTTGIGQISMHRYQERADAYYATGQYSKAIPDYERFLHKKKDTQTMLKLATSFQKTQHFQKALALYKTLVQQNSTADTLNLLYADLLKRQQQYSEAKEQYLLLSRQFPGNKKYPLYAQYCDSAMMPETDPHIEIEPLRSVNSPYSDITPVQYKNGLVFSSNRETTLIKKKTSDTNLPFYDLYIATGKDSLTYTRVSPFSSKLNTVHHECCASFTGDYKKIFYTRSLDVQPGDGQGAKNTLKMFSAAWENNTWQEPYSFRFNDSTHSYGQPTVEASEELFFFTSDRLDGYGGTDLYVCFNIDHKWTDPINLGPKINTPYNELYPFFHPDGTLYFSSNRPEGFGGYDLYKATENDQGDYDNVIHLGAPINSPEDDLSIFWNADYSIGYFSSNREGGMGLEDLYRILKK